MANKKYDYLIVGAGLFGATFAFRAKNAGKKCLVIDKRDHLGGNVYCEKIAGINVHKYGAHIFHTSNRDVWNFVNSIVPFNHFINSPLANFRGKFFNLPFNMNTFRQMWGVETAEEARAKIDEQRRATGITEPKNLEEQALMLVGNDIYQTLIKGYTEKQWGRACRDLPAFIIKRLPVRFTFDNNYFNDTFQGIPIGGYNRLIDGLLAGTETRTGTDFFAAREHFESLAEKIVFTGKIDEFFDYKLGKLEYRTLRFEHEILPTANYQNNAVINFTEREIPYTRIIEHKHFELFGNDILSIPQTVITREFPAEFNTAGTPCVAISREHNATGTQNSEPFYPINDAKNNALAERYRELAKSVPAVLFGGRLAEYRYYDMAPIIEKVLNLEI